MNLIYRLIALAAVPFILMMLITGCKPSEPPQTIAQTAPAPEPVAAPPAVQPDLRSSEAPASSSGVPAADGKEAAHPGDKVTLSSAEAGKDQEKSANPAKTPPAPKPKIEVKETYSQAKPSLMGLTLKASPETVTALFGEPKEQYTMEDETDPLTVYDYTDFLVGFNKKKQLQFVDVRSDEVNPGLNGLKLGQKVEDAYEALGKPDTNTSYVLAYKSEGTVLKLDVDPKTGQINSIKLFAGK